MEQGILDINFEEIWERIWKVVEKKYIRPEYWRIITDQPIPFPKNYELVGHHRMLELSNVPWDKHPRQGWDRPHKIIGDVEIHYLDERNGVRVNW